MRRHPYGGGPRLAHRAVTRRHGPEVETLDCLLDRVDDRGRRERVGVAVLRGHDRLGERGPALRRGEQQRLGTETDRVPVTSLPAWARRSAWPVARATRASTPDQRPGRAVRTQPSWRTSRRTGRSRPPRRGPRPAASAGWTGCAPALRRRPARGYAAGTGWRGVADRGAVGEASASSANGSPIAFPTASRSRATLTVSRCDSSAPERRRQLSAKARLRATSAVNAAGPRGSRSSAVGFSAGSQDSGVLSPTPRGSSPMMSKRRRSSAGKSWTARSTSWVVLPPGPPGLMKSAPTRPAVSVAGSTCSDRVMAVPSGAAQSSGTRTWPQRRPATGMALSVAQVTQVTAGAGWVPAYATATAAGNRTASAAGRAQRIVVSWMPRLAGSAARRITSQRERLPHLRETPPPPGRDGDAGRGPGRMRFVRIPLRRWACLLVGGALLAPYR